MPARISPRSVPEVLPVLGLSDIVIFPGMVAPLLVETSQSIHLIDDVVGGDRLLGVVLQRKPEVENPLPQDMYEVGCAARVLKMLKFPDNTVRVLVEGLWRIQIKGYEAQVPYLKAKIEILKDVTEPSLELTALTRNAQTQFQEIVKLSPAMADQVKIAALNTDDPGHLTDLIAVNLNLSLEERQQMLENSSVRERLTRLLPMLNRELEVLTLEFENPDRRRKLNVEDAAGFLPAGTVARHPTGAWAKVISTRRKSRTCANRLTKCRCRRTRRKWRCRNWNACRRCRRQWRSTA